MNCPSQEVLQEWFAYRDGQLFWKKSPCTWIKPGDKAGSQHRAGYEEVGFQGKSYLVHRLVFMWHHGWCPDLIDHIDQSRDNHRIDNLRPATKRENALNSKIQSNNKSGVRGVSWDKGTQKWTARYKVGGKYRFGGYFDTVEKAAQKRKEMEEFYG